jgi:hypothetical protein
MTLDESMVWSTFGRQELIDFFGTLAEAQAEWRHRRNLVKVNPGTVPEAFWALDGPTHLRNPRGTATTHDQQIKLADALEARRRTWLEATGGDWTRISAPISGDEL